MIKKATNNDTELIFILDKSGSMFNLESDTIGGFNSLISRQKKTQTDGRCFVSTVLFNEKSFVLHDRVELENIGEMTDSDYSTSGCTALLDAMGGAIKHIGNIHKYARREDVPSKTLFVIITDGMENASHNFDGKKIKQLVERQQKKYGWEFLFIGANIDSIAAAKSYGISPSRAKNYNADSVGTSTIYEAVSDTVCSYRSSAPISADWGKKIDDDYKNRKS